MALVIKGNIKKYTDLNVSEEFMVELEKQTEFLLKRAEDRAKANGRRTLYARDV